MSARLIRIDFLRFLGLDTSVFDAMTDEEYSELVEYLEDRYRSQTEGLPSGPVYRNPPSSHGNPKK